MRETVLWETPAISEIWRMVGRPRTRWVMR
jgi:hypothetical protein